MQVKEFNDLVQGWLTEKSSYLCGGFFVAIAKLIWSFLTIGILSVAMTVCLLIAFVTRLVSCFCCCICCWSEGQLYPPPNRVREGPQHESICVQCAAVQQTTSHRSMGWLLHLMSIWINTWPEIVFSVLAIASCSLFPFVFKKVGDDKNNPNLPVSPPVPIQDPPCCFSTKNYASLTCSCCCPNACSCIANNNNNKQAVNALPPAPKSIQTVELPPPDARHVITPFAPQMLVTINLNNPAEDIYPA